MSISPTCKRQIIHSTKDINRPKVASAKDKIKAINPEIQVETYNTTLSSKNALEIIREYDLVVDGTDNYPTRYLINDACVLLGKPLVYGSIFQFEGQASVFLCRARALLPLPLSRATAAGAGALLRGRRRGRCVAGHYWHYSGRGSHQAYRRRQRGLIGRLLLFDVWQMKQRELRLERDPGCPVCGEHPSIHALIDYEEFCGLKPDESEAPIESVTALELHAWIEEENPATDRHS
ncbi:ThiF family adenylyltransferase [Klebsiella variicola subsp. variicola]|nr:ThiF family adenylyltransferase [Klebsiella variicola subsp. variicola]